MKRSLLERDNKPEKVSCVCKIISGGQTGAERAGLDVAIKIAKKYGGYLLKGRKTDDGALSKKYKCMTELSTETAFAQTTKNIIEADGTLIFTMGAIEKDIAFVINQAQKCDASYIRIDLSKYLESKAGEIVSSWLKRVQPKVLNITGTHETAAKGIYAKVTSILLQVL